MHRTAVGFAGRRAGQLRSAVVNGFFSIAFIGDPWPMKRAGMEWWVDMQSPLFMTSQKPL
jgi:hypothetical protein